MAAGLIAAEPSPAQPFNFWSVGIGDAGAEELGAVAIDAAGNVFLAASFWGVINVGGDYLVSAGDRDILLVKYAPDGTYLWSQRFGDANPDLVDGLGVDAWGNVVIGGRFYGSINLGGGARASAGSADVFVAKYNANGVYQWDVTAGSAASDYVNGLAVDPGGDVVATGGFNGTINFGGGNLTPAGLTDIFLVRLRNDGAHLWSERFGGTSSDAGVELDVAKNGDILFGGVFSNTVDFGGGNLVSAGQTDIVLARFDADGAHVWSQGFGSAGTESIEGVAEGPAGNIVTTGSFMNTVDFGGGGLVSAGQKDIFLARYTAGGTHLWSLRFGDTDLDRGYACDHLASGDIVLTGDARGNIDFGGGTHVGLGSSDIFVARFDTSGAYQSDTFWGSAALETGSDVHADGAGGFVLTGVYQTALDFGSGALTPHGSYDIFVARFKDGGESPAITAIEDVGNDEGREVRIDFDAPVHDDVASSTQVLSYEVYRRDDAAPAAVSRKGGGPQAIPGWTYVASAPAHAEPGYSVIAPTIGDSTISSGQYQSVFFVRAATGAPTVFHDSAPDSGYSLDNLAPPAPASVVLASGTLSWDASVAADFDYFTVYGSNSNDFGGASPVGQSTTPGLDVTGSPYAFYFVTATDFAGNESDPGTPGVATGIGTPVARGLSLTAHPNPFNPNTSIAFTVPASGAVTLQIYDARGALVKTLIEGAPYAAGDYRIPWGGRNRAGSVVGSGVYFVRIEHGGATRTHKIVLLK